MNATRMLATVGLAACAALMLATTPVAASGGRTTNEKTAFTNTGADDDASGVGKLQLKHGSDGRLDLKVKRLDRRTTGHTGTTWGIPLVAVVATWQTRSNATSLAKVFFRHMRREVRRCAGAVNAVLAGGGGASDLGRLWRFPCGQVRSSIAARRMEAP